ncbi:MAG: hypothetical protein HQK60_10610, partial [Deltaproteobacteria bacterium]|nr:hypothetical protein [Deltaproteobacteria bacterium]
MIDEENTNRHVSPSLTASIPRFIFQLLENPIIWIVSGGTILISQTLFFIRSQMVNHDVAGILYQAQEVARGAVIYRDFSDLNPPLFTWVHLPPVWLADFLGIPFITSFYIYFAMVIVLCLAMCGMYLKYLYVDDAPVIRFFILLGTLGLSVFVFQGTILPPKYFSFGHREHFIVLFILPYLLGAAVEASGKRVNHVLTSATGLLAAISLALKPYYLVLWLLVEGYLSIIKRDPRSWLRPQNFIIGLTLFFYGLAVILFWPDYFKFVDWVLRYYGSYEATTAKMLDLVLKIVVLFGLPTVVLVFFLAAKKDASLCHILLLAALAAILVFYYQKKGWHYQLYPIYCFLGVIFFVTVGRWLVSRPGVWGLALMTGFLILFPVWSVSKWSQPPPINREAKAVARYIKPYAQGQYIYVFAFHVFEVFPL